MREWSDWWIGIQWKAILLITAGAVYAEALRCGSIQSANGEICGSSLQVCTSYSYFGKTFKGCMEKLTQDGSDACAVVKSLDESACCCTTDLCNSGENGCESKRRLQEITFAPTTYSIAGSEFCAVPFDFNGLFTTPCDFGTKDGWAFVNSTHTIRNLQGCISLDEAVPLDGNNLLSSGDKWCPIEVNGNGEYDALSPAWGRCECSPCRIQPNAEVPGIAQSGLCDFANLESWVYIFENGTEVTGLPIGCVKVGEYPPLGYSDIGVSENALWCPGDMEGTGVYDMRDQEAAQSWGICECVPPTTAQPSTNTPSVAPTPAPTTVSTANGQFCEILSEDNTRQNCNFGSTGDWTYLGAELSDPPESGLVGCVPIGLFPPRLVDDQRTLDEETLWCPGPNGLDVANTYDVKDPVSSLSWGVCGCSNCRIKDEASGGGGGGSLVSGVCDFGSTEDDTWTYVGENGIAINITKCATIADAPPFGVLNDLPGDTLWCPGSSGKLSGTNEYHFNDEVTQSNWGLCECLVTQPPTVVEFSDAPSASPTEQTDLPSPAPTPRPTTLSPTVAETEAPTPEIVESATPTRSPLVFETYCEITSIPPASTATANTACGFGSNKWEYADGNILTSGLMSGCVSIGAFPPFGSAGMDESLLWCPSADALNPSKVYDPNGESASSWGFCQCDNCQIIVVDDQISGPVQSGICSMGADRTWLYQPLGGNVDDRIAMVGCASMEEFPPLLPSMNVTAEFPPGTLWCPAVGGLSESESVYSFLGVDADPTQWGLCTCDATVPPTPDTKSPVPGPTRFGDTHGPTISPTNKPTTKTPSRLPSVSPTLPTPAPTTPTPTQLPTASPHCCQVVSGGPVSSGTCDFGEGSWAYQGFGSRTSGLQGCVDIDKLIPFNSSNLRNQNLKWCPTLEPPGLNMVDTYGYLNTETRSNWGVCECPCMPSMAPTTAKPTFAPNEVDRLALFIQADHSGSIRLADRKCLSQTGGLFDCWRLLSNFVQNLVSNITATIGGPSKLRLHLSTFSCVNQNPTNKILTDGLTSFGDTKAVDAALTKLRKLSEKTMHGTCPSRGAGEIAKIMGRLPADLPIAYLIVTDGRVNGADENNYGRLVRELKTKMRNRRGENVCVSTIGFQDLGQINRLLKTNCVFPAVDFIEIATGDYSKKVAYSILGVTDPPTSSGGGGDGGILTATPYSDDGDDGDGSPPDSSSSSSSSRDQDSRFAATISATFVVVGIVVLGGIYLLTHRKRKRHVPRPHRPAEETFWVNNPAAKPASPPPAEDGFNNGSQQPPARRRSRASSEITFIDLPPPPPLSTYPSPLPPPPPLSPSCASPPNSFSFIGSPHPMFSRASPAFNDIEQPTPSSAASSSSSFFRKTTESAIASEQERARKNASKTPSEMMLKSNLSPFSSSASKSMSKRAHSPSKSTSMGPVIVKEDGFDEPLSFMSSGAKRKASDESSGFGIPSSSPPALIGERHSPLKQVRKSLNFMEGTPGVKREKDDGSLSPLRSSKKEPSTKAGTLSAYTWE